MAERWLVVAGSAAADIYRMGRAADALEAIETLEHPRSRLRDRDFDADRPGRSFDSHGQGRHAMGSEVDSHRHEAMVFAKDLARHLEAARVAGRLEELVIAAPPRFLGLLRDELDEPTRRCIQRTIDKSLLGKSASEIAGTLRGAG